MVCRYMADGGRDTSISPLQYISVSCSFSCTLLPSNTAANSLWNLSFSLTTGPLFLLEKCREQDANPFHRDNNPQGMCLMSWSAGVSQKIDEWKINPALHGKYTFRVWHLCSDLDISKSSMKCTLEFPMSVSWPLELQKMCPPFP